jgi:hypothetical protein
MAQITQAERIQRINQLVAELNRMPPEKHEVERIPWKGGDLLCQVINISVNEVLLNHGSHRVRAQLEDDPEWGAHKNDPQGEAAQRLIQRHVRAARKDEEFAALKESLEREGQTHAGVMTYEGVLVNANTRLVALREVDDPSKRYIRVAVLPSTAQAEELSLLELRLQMQKELKVDYTLTNELLFIEELSQRGTSNMQIARELRIDPDKPKKGEREIGDRLRMLDLVRAMQSIPKERLALTFFDTLAYEQLREVQRIYYPMLEHDSESAQRYIDSFLLSVAVGVTPVHQIRRIDPSFMADYMAPQLEEDEVIGPVADQLLSGDESSASSSVPSGVSALSGKDAPTEDAINVKALLDIVTQKEKRVEIPNTNIVADREDVKQAVKASIITGIKEKRRDDTAADKLETPAESIKSATKLILKCMEVLVSVRTAPDFDERRRKGLEMAFKKLKKRCRELEVALEKSDVISGS